MKRDVVFPVAILMENGLLEFRSRKAQAGPSCHLHTPACGLPGAPVALPGGGVANTSTV